MTWLSVVDSVIKRYLPGSDIKSTGWEHIWKSLHSLTLTRVIDITNMLLVYRRPISIIQYDYCNKFFTIYVILWFRTHESTQSRRIWDRCNCIWLNLRETIACTSYSIRGGHSASYFIWIFIPQCSDNKNEYIDKVLLALIDCQNDSAYECLFSEIVKNAWISAHLRCFHALIQSER